VEAFATPLGSIRLDAPAIARIAELPQVVFSDHVHAFEHSLEVHLPFLQRVLEQFTWCRSPSASHAGSRGRGAGPAVGRPETLIVVSSDLSHFLPYATRSRSTATPAGISCNSTPTSTRQACGAFPINGLLLAAGRRGLTPALLGLCNSGDTAGDRSRVVGYAAFLPKEPTWLISATLLILARNAIAAASASRRSRLATARNSTPRAPPSSP
jgi:AmmeMemoRadiSam system protein B